MYKTVTPAGVIPVDGTVRPVAWVIEYAGNEKELYFDRKPYGLSQSPLYDQAALDAAVAAERERCAKVAEAEDVAPTDDALGVQQCIASSIRRA